MQNITTLEKMKQLKKVINNASDAYYNGISIMSDKEWDMLYDEYSSLEKENRIILSDSPTQNVGFEVVSKLQKIKHDTKMLSLDKTKDKDILLKFLNNKQGILSWKLDGLTVVLKYNDGKLISAITRGNGEIGEDILHNVKHFSNVPLYIDYKEELTIRGEALISKENFKIINEKENGKYKNSRNLVSGTVRQLDSKIVSERYVDFIAFEVINDIGINNKIDSLDKLSILGITTVERVLTTEANLFECIENFSSLIPNYKYETDGLVLTFNDIEYSKSLGVTSKVPKDSMAFKWKDDVVETTLLGIEWNPSRTGLINPIALFEPVEIEGTTVSKASVHNVSIVKELEMGIGDTISVYKANCIIPQVLENLTRSNNIPIPISCPTCNTKTEIVKNDTCEVLMCLNEDCNAKLVGKIVHFCSRDALNIDGISESTIEKFVEEGFLKTISDLYTLKRYKDRIINMDGFGIRSYNNIIEAIENSKKCYMNNFLYGFGINQIGRSASKTIAKQFNYNWFDFEQALLNDFDFTTLDDFGEKAHNSIYNWYNQDNIINCAGYYDVCKLSIFMDWQYPKTNDVLENTNSKLKGLLFVITGDVEIYKNRKELQSKIEELGGKVAGSVSSKTSYLINNDKYSTSSKNQKAKELNISIINEDDFLELIK